MSILPVGTSGGNAAFDGTAIVILDRDITFEEQWESGYANNANRTSLLAVVNVRSEGQILQKLSNKMLFLGPMRMDGLESLL